MKKTMLTCKTLDRFEAEYITDTYTEKELDRVEFAAYVANMNQCNHPEWTEDDIFADFIRVLGIDHITVTTKAAEKEQKMDEPMITLEALKSALKHHTDRSAWGRGVNAYALELVEELRERAAYEGRNPEPGKECREWMLNGAQDWNQYSWGGSSLVYDGDIAERLCTPSELNSWGGSSLVYDGDIAERLCTPSELKKTRHGERRPNSREEWLDTQARALTQACNRVDRLYRSIVTAQGGRP